MASSLPSSFNMPIPKVPKELFASVRENLAKMDKLEAEDKRRREALLEKRWKERYSKKKSGVKSPLFATWAGSGSSSGADGNEPEQVKSSLEPDNVGSSLEKTSSAKDDSSCSSPELPSQESSNEEQEAVIPEEELIRRRKVEEELIALSNKITEEKKRQERIIPLVWDKPTFDPFPSAAAAKTTTDAAAKSDDSDNSSSCKAGSQDDKHEESKGQQQTPDSRKRRNEDQGSTYPYRHYYEGSASWYDYGYMGGVGCSRSSPREARGLVSFAEKWISAHKKRSKKSSAEDE